MIGPIGDVGRFMEAPYSARTDLFVDSVVRASRTSPITERTCRALRSVGTPEVRQRIKPTSNVCPHDLPLRHAAGREESHGTCLTHSSLARELLAARHRAACPHR